MSFTKTHYLVLIPSALLGFVAALQLTGCSESPVGLPSETAGGGGQGGMDPEAGGGSTNIAEAGDKGETSQAGETGEAGEAGEAGGASHGHPEGGSTASGGTIEGGGGASAGDGGSLTSAGSGGQGGTLTGVVIPPTCTFHTPPISTGGGGGDTGAGGAGTGGTGGTGATITLQTSTFVGSYLGDATGRTLYTYGNDLPGDCNTPPVSNCVTVDCLISWPIVPSGARILAPGLDDAAFGEFQRSDGLWQTTYYGWPIYYYKTDLALYQYNGQGKAKTWHIVEKKLPGVFIMKPGSTKYLSDSSGHTLYVSAADQAGTATADPVSNCSGSCMSTFEPFHETNFSVVGSLLTADFGSFVQPGKTSIQVAYKGMPLYRAATDLKSGDLTGTSVSGFTAALP